jgi:hypothetical protein
VNRVAVGIFAALMALPSVARADDAVRVVISGAKKDPLATRLEKELVALGFAPVAVGPLQDCGGTAIENAVKNAGASAALCSNSGKVAVWTDDGHELKLRDTVVARDAHAAETIAMQAAEVMRANIAFREPEPVIPPPEKAAAPGPTADWSDFDNEDHSGPKPKKKEEASRAALFTVSAGASYLMSSSAALSALSFHSSVRAHRYVSLTLHADVPVTGTRATPMTTTPVPDGSHVRVTPGIAGAGVEIPFTNANSVVQPRLGASVGVAWVYASKTAGALSDQLGSFISATEEVNDTIVAPAGWASAGFSFQLAGPLRLIADGLIGATAGGVTIRNQTHAIARWGLPLAAVGLRAELLWQ